MKRPIRLLSVVALSGAMLTSTMTLTGCADGRQQETGGAIIGGVLGAVAGSRFGQGQGKMASVAVGTLLGAWAGSEIGKRLDERDRLMAGQAQDAAMEAPIGEPVTWNNPNSGNSGRVVATRDGTNTATGEYCREYETTITVDGQLERATGTACQRPDGTWRLVQ